MINLIKLSVDQLTEARLRAARHSNISSHFVSNIEIHKCLYRSSSDPFVQMSTKLLAEEIYCSERVFIYLTKLKVALKTNVIFSRHLKFTRLLRNLKLLDSS